MPPSSPRMSWNFPIPCFATKSRTFFWFVAVFGLSAGTRWSKMMAIFDGSQGFASRPVPSQISRNWLITSAAVFVRHGEVDLRLDHLPRLHRRQARGAGQDLLDDCHAHGFDAPLQVASDDALLLRVPHCPRRVAEPPQDLLRVLAESRGGAVSTFPGVRSNFAVRLKSRMLADPLARATFCERLAVRRPAAGAAPPRGTGSSPEGTSFCVEHLDPLAVGFSFSFASSSGVSSLRFFLRASRFWKRGSFFSSGTPSTSATASHCSCLLAAMLMTPSCVANVPTGRRSCCRCPAAAGAARRSAGSRRPTP